MLGMRYLAHSMRCNRQGNETHQVDSNRSSEMAACSSQGTLISLLPQTRFDQLDLISQAQ